MSRLQEELNNVCDYVCKELCKHSEAVGGRNVLDITDQNALDDDEFEEFFKAHCQKCQINDLHD